MSLLSPEDSRKPIHLLEVAAFTEILSKGVITFNITERSGSQLYRLRSVQAMEFPDFFGKAVVHGQNLDIWEFGKGARIAN